MIVHLCTFYKSIISILPPLDSQPDHTLQPTGNFVDFHTIELRQPVFEQTAYRDGPAMLDQGKAVGSQIISCRQRQA